jgi:gliding motility-associated-like protein
MTDPMLSNKKNTPNPLNKVMTIVHFFEKLIDTASTVARFCIQAYPANLHCAQKRERTAKKRYSTIYFLLASTCVLLSITGSFAQGLNVTGCPVVAKRSNGNGQAARAAGYFPGYGQNNPVAVNVVGTKYDTLSYDPTVKTGNVNFKWSSATTISKLPVITRVWVNAEGSNSGSLSAIKFGPPPVPVIVGQDYFVDYSFYGQNMPPAGKVTLEFADPQTNAPAFRCTFDLRSNASATEPTVLDCAPTFTTQPSNQSICGASSAAFTIVADGATGIQWQVSNSSNGVYANITNGGDYSGATSATLVIINPTTYDGKYYRAVAIGSGSCGNTNSNGALLIAKPKPTAVFSGSTSLCGTGSRSLGVSLTGTGPWSITYTTTPSGGSTTVSNIISSPFYFSVNPSGATTYAITSVSDAYCTNSTLTGNVSTTVSVAPTITPSNANSCFGSGSFNLSYSSTGSPNQYTLTAGVRAMPGFTTITNATLSGSPVTISIPSNTVAGVYDFNLVVTNSTTGCSSTSVPITVTVRALPSVNATSGNGTVCAGATTTLTASPSGLSAYSWTISPSATVVATGATPTVTVGTSPSYTYIVTGTDAYGCSATASVNITTVSGPSLSITPSSPTICSGNATTLTASGGNTYSWSPSTGLSATTGASVVASPASTTTYTVTSQNVTGCQSVGTVTVTVNTPAIGVTSSATICSGTSKVLTATGGSTYAWYPSTGLSATTGATVTATPTATTTYYVQGTDANGCVGTASSTVSISPAPVNAATSTANAIIFCTTAVSSFPLTVNTTSTPTSMTWSYSTNGTSYTTISGATSITGVTLTPSSSGATNAVLTLSGYGNSGYSGARYFRLVIVTPTCTYNYDIYVTDTKASSSQSPAPAPTASQTSICSGNSVTLSVGTLASGSTVQWQVSTTSSTSGFADISGATSSTYTASPTVTSYYKVTYNSGGCAGLSSPVTITVASALTANTVSPSSTCTDGTSAVTLTGTAITGGIFQWQSSTTSSSTGFTDILGATSQNYTLPTNIVSVVTWYSRIASTSSCATNSSASVAVYPPIANNQITNSITSFCTTAPATVLANTTPVGGTGTYTYQWQSSTDGTNFSNVSDGTGGTTQNYTTASHTQSYWYRRVVTSGGCSSTSGSFKITVNATPSVSVTAGSSQCAGNAITLTASGAVSYSWSPSTELSATSGTSVTVTATSTRTYTVTGTDGNGCTATATSTITVTAAPSTPTLSVSTKTICSGTSANLNSLVTSGGTFEWYTAPEVNASYKIADPTTVSSAGTYYVFAKSGSCYSVSSASVTLTVANVTAPVPLLTSLTSCNNLAGNATADLTAIQPSPASGVSFEWHTASSNPAAGNLVGTPSAVANGTYYLYAFSSGGACYGTASSAVTVTINPLATASVSSTNVSVCAPATINLNTYNNTSGTNTYSWYSTNNPIPANLVLIPTEVSQTGTYYLYATSTAGCQGAASSGITATVNNKPTAAISSPASVCSGTARTITATSNAASPTYQWQISSDNGANWTDLTNTGVYTGVTTSSLNISNTTGLGGLYYRYTVTSNTSCSSTSDAAILVEETTPTVNTQPANITVNMGNSASFTASISGSPTADFQWQISTNNGSSFSDISDYATYSGVNSATLVIPSTILAQNTYQYKATISNSCNTLSTNAAILTVANCTAPTPSFTTAPSGSYCINTTDVTYTTESGKTNYVWSVPGTLNTDYTISSGGTGSASNTVTLRWLSSGSKTVTVNYTDACPGIVVATNTITISPASVGGSISGGATVCTGTNSTTLTLSGHTGTVTKWQSASTADFSGTVTDIANTTTTLTATNLSATTNYRAVVTSGSCASENSSNGVVTVSPASVGGSISGGATVCTGTNSTTLTLSGHTGTVTKWQSALAADFSGTVTDIANTTTTLTATNLSATTHYRAVVTSGSCVSENSSNGVITVSPASVGGSISGGATVCTGTNSTTLTLSGHTGTVTKWQSALTADFSGTVTDIANTTTTLTATNLSATTYYRAVITSGSCASANSSNGVVTVSPASVGGSISGGATVCTGTNSTTLTLSGHTGTVTKWQSALVADFSGTVTDIANTTTTLTATNLSATTYYRAVVTSGSCVSENSSNGVITVSPASVGGSISGGATVCTGTNSTTLTLSGQTGTVTKWQSASTADFSGTVTDIANTTTTLTATNLSATTHYRAVVQQGSCVAVNSGLITVNVSTLPTVTVNPAVGAIASGSSLTLTASGADTYTWSPSTGLSATNAAVVTATLSASATYTVTGTLTATGCINTKNITVNVINPGVIAGAQSGCGAFTPTGFTSTTDASGAAPLTYQWQSSSSADFSTGVTTIAGAASAFYNAGKVSATTYFRRVVMFNGTPFYSNIITASINALPAIAALSNSSVCAGGTLSLTSTAGNSSYNWTGPNGFSSTQQNPVITSATNAASGNYTVTATGSNGCTASATTSVVINALPTIRITPSSATIQIGSNISLTASGGNSYSWSPSTGLSLANSAVVSAAPLTTTSYIVTGTNTVTGCSNTATIKVSVLNIDAIDDDFRSKEINGAKGDSLAGVLTNDKLNNIQAALSSVNLTLVSNGGITGLAFNTNGQLVIPANTLEGTYTATYSICEKVNPTNCNQANVLIKISRGLALTATAVCKNDVPYIQYKVVPNFTPGTASPVTLTWLNGDKSVLASQPVLTSQALEAEVLWAGATVDAKGNGTDWPGWYTVKGQWVQGNDGFEKTRPDAYLVISVNPTDTIKISYPPATPACNAAPPTIVTPINPGTIAADQTICTGTSPDVLTSKTAASGGNSTIVYQWQQSTDNINFTDIANATSEIYAPSVLTQTTYYRRAAGSSANTVVYTSSVKISTVAKPVITGGINGPCAMPKDSIKTFSVTSPPDVTAYVWTIPSGWSGVSTTNSIDVKSGRSNGTISVVPYIGSCAGTGVNYSVVIIDYAKVTITGTPVTAAGNNNNPIQVKIQLIDVNGNLVSCSGGIATLCSNSGLFSTVVDNNDGTYISTLTSPANDVTICGSVAGVPILQTTKVTFTGPQGGIKGNGPILATETPKITFTATAGRAPFTVIYHSEKSPQGKNDTLTNYTSGKVVPVSLIPSTTRYTLVSVTDANGESRINNFIRDTATIVVLAPKVIITLHADVPVKEKDSTWSTRITVNTKNIGDLDLSNSQARLNLKDVFPSPVTYVLDSVKIYGTTVVPNKNYDGVVNTDLFAKLNKPRNDLYTATSTTHATMFEGAAPDGSADMDIWRNQNELEDSLAVIEDGHSIYMFGALSSLPVGIDANVILWLHIKPNGYSEPFVMQGVALGTGSTEGATALATSVSNDNNDVALHPEVTKLGDPVPTVINLFPTAMIGASLSASAPALQGNGTYNVTLSYRVKNYGNVNLTSVRLSQNLLRSVGAPSAFNIVGPVLSTGTILLNPSFDAKTDTNLLASTSMLAFKQEATVSFTINITPNQLASVYRLQATASGFSDDVNTTVADLSNDGTEPDTDGNNIPSERVITSIVINLPIPPLVPGNIGIKTGTTTVSAKGYCVSANGIEIIPTSSNSGGLDSYQYQWQISTDNILFKDIIGAESDTYTTGLVENSIYLRRATISGSQVKYSNSVYIQIYPAVPTPIIAGTGTIVVGKGNITLTSPAAASYAWSTGATTRSIVAQDAGNYSLTITDANGCTAVAAAYAITAMDPAKVADVKKILSKAPSLQQDGSFLLSFNILASNLRTELLDSVKLKDDLSRVFPTSTTFSVVDIKASGALIANSSYDGKTQINLLNDVSQLPAYKTDSVQFTVKVFPNGYAGTLNNIVNLAGRSPFGTVTVASNDPINNGNPAIRLPTKFVLPLVDIFIPSGFSPNHDGTNDLFVITRPFNTTINLEVFNRWSNLVYKSPDYKNEWDGRGNQSNRVMGEDLPDGTYYYVVVATEKATGFVRKFTGYITLKR